jgi:hypothetical protein
MSFHRPDLTMAIEATSRLGPLVSSEEIVLTVTMYNPTGCTNHPSRPRWMLVAVQRE